MSYNSFTYATCNQISKSPNTHIKMYKHCTHILNLNADYLENNLCKEIAVLYVGISLHALSTNI